MLDRLKSRSDLAACTLPSNGTGDDDEPFQELLNAMLEAPSAGVGGNLSSSSWDECLALDGSSRHIVTPSARATGWWARTANGTLIFSVNSSRATKADLYSVSDCLVEYGAATAAVAARKTLKSASNNEIPDSLSYGENVLSSEAKLRVHQRPLAHSLNHT